MKIDKYLNQIYTNPKNPYSFGSFRNLYKEGKKKYPHLTLNYVKKFLQKNLIYQIHKPLPKIKYRQKILSSGIDKLWQADLIDLKKNHKRKKDIKTFGFNYILCCIDIFSKFSLVEPIRNKSANSVLKAFGTIIKRAKLYNHNTPERLHTDKGTEFFNKKLYMFFKNNNIYHYSTEGLHKAANCERFNRTLMTKLQKIYSYKYNKIKRAKQYKSLLQAIVNAYNNKKSRTHGYAPIKVNKENTDIVWNKLYGEYFKKTPRIIHFMLGDNVLVSKRKTGFTKGYKSNYLKKKFKIHDISLNTFPIKYTLIDNNNNIITQRFYSDDLQLTK